MVDALQVPPLLVAAGSLAFAAWVIAVRPTHSVHRALGVFLLLRGLLYGLQSTSPNLTEWLGRSMVYVLLGIPFAAVWFAHVVQRWYRSGGGGHGSPIVLVAVVAVCAATLVAHLVDRTIFLGPDGPGPFLLAAPATGLAYAVIALSLALTVRSAAQRLERRALGTVAFGFSLEPAFSSAYYLVDRFFSTAGWDAITVGDVLLYSITLMVLAAFAVVRLTGRSHHGHPRAFPLVVLAVAAASGVAVALYAAGADQRSGIFALRSVDAVWHLALVALLAYALLRQQLFGLEVKVHFAIKGTTLATVFLAVFFVVNKVTENVVAERFPDGNVGIYAGGAVVGLLLFALAPLQRLAERLATVAVPGNQKVSAMAAREKADLFREQARFAWRDGAIDMAERRRLDSLRDRLGLGAAKAAAIESEAARKAPDAGAIPRVGDRHRRASPGRP